MRLTALVFVLVMAVLAVGCNPPPTCDATLTRLTNIGNTPNNVFRYVIPANPTLEPNSDAIISTALVQNGGNTQILGVINGWSSPVYYVGPSESKNTYITIHYGNGPGYDNVTSAGPIRWRSCMTGSTESDGQATWIDTVDNCQYEAWMLNKDLGFADPEAGFVCGLPIDDPTQVWEPYEGVGSTAGSGSVYCSSLWPDECTTSYNHGFMIGVDWGLNYPTPVAPFYHADGTGTTTPNHLHEGMRLQLNPAYDISGLPLYARTAAQALKTYGGIDGNSTVGTWGIYGINPQGYTNNCWTGVLPDPSVGSFNIVPVSQMRVLAKTADTTSGPAGVSNSCISYQGSAYTAPPTITTVSPSSAAAGATVTLTGTNFTGAFSVRFNDTAATNVTVVSATSITCTVPAGSGTAKVNVRTNNGSSNLKDFTYSGGGGSAPTLSSITPNNGSTAGGTACTLAGTYLTGCSAVSFGGTAATGIVVDSASQVRCTSPVRSAGAISVTATTSYGTSNGVTYTYNAPAPTLSAINPSSGTTNGGTACTLTGTNLTGCSAVAFGANAATGIVVDSATQVRCTSPAGSAGAVNVNATTSAGTSGNVTYTYTAGGTSYTSTLYSPADSCVASTSAGSNFGTTNLVVQKNAASEFAAYIKFDMTTISGTTITSAKLNLCLISAAAATTEKIYSCATDTWVETSITWNNKPAWGTQQASFSTPTTANTYVSVDVTSYINANFNGDKLVTLVVRDDANLNQNRQYYSDETGASTSRRPYLIVISQ